MGGSGHDARDGARPSPANCSRARSAPRDGGHDAHHHPRGRPARRPADGEAGRPDRAEDRLDPTACWPPASTSSRSARSSTRRRSRRWPTPTSCSARLDRRARAGRRGALGPGAEREGARARPGLRRRDVLHGRLGQRDPQPEEHRHGHRRGHRAHHRDGEAGRGGGQAGAGLGAVGLRLRLRGPGAPRSACSAIVRRVPRRRACATSAWPTRPATPTRRRSSGCSARSARSTPTVECACHFHNTYGLGLANCYAALRRRRDVLRVVVRRPGRLPVHQGRGRQRRHRGPRARAAAAGPAPRHRPGRR